MRRLLALLALLGWSGLFAATRAAASAPPESGSPDHLVHTWRTDEGLPQNWVSSLAQTPDGYLWVGTRYGGLARFDGVRFVAFNPQNTPALQDVQVEHLDVDAAGTLWIVMGNESVTAYRDGRFTLHRLPRSEPRVRVDSVLARENNSVLFAAEGTYLARLSFADGTNRWERLAPDPPAAPGPVRFWPDREGAVWYATPDRKLARFHQGRFEALPDLGRQANSRVTALALDGTGALWVAAADRLIRRDGAGFADATPTEGDHPTNVLQMAFSGDGGLWVLEESRLRKRLRGAWTVTVPLPGASVGVGRPQVRLHGDAAGEAWLIRYGQGLWQVTNDGRMRSLTEGDGLPSSFITQWFQDVEGHVWIGTAGDGMARIRPRAFHVLGPAEGLPDKVARSVAVDARGDLWAGTMSGGLVRRRADGITAVPLPPLNQSPIESITVCPSRDGGVWIGSLRHGLMRWADERVTRPIPVGEHSDSIRVLFEDRQGGLWFGGLVDLYRHAGGTTRRYGAEEGWPGSIAVGAIAEDTDGAVWIGTGPGDLWRHENNRFTRFAPPSDWPSTRFAALLPDTNGVVWIGTLGGGLVRFQGGHFQRFTRRHGLPDDHVTQLLADDEGHLWAGTYAGIVRIRKDDLNALASAADDPGRLPCRVYGRFDGLPALECPGGFQPSCWRSPEGRLWFTTANGIVHFDPAAIPANRRPPNVRVEEMWVDGEQRALPDAGTGAPAVIEPGRHYVQFRFTGLSFAAPDAVRFRAKLEGVDGDWLDCDDRRQIGYGPLPPGSYRFRVSACNNEGLWSASDATVALVVRPFLWETGWFRGCLLGGSFALLAAIVALVQRRRYRQRLERLERQRAMERERARIAQDLHDDLGTSLTQIGMLGALASRPQTPPVEVVGILDQMRGLARASVTSLDEIVWAVNPRNDSLAGLVNYLGHFAEEFFRPTAIRCRLDLPDSLPDRPIGTETRHHLFLAFKEAVNNAARHSGADEVRVAAEWADGELRLRIADNGRGFDPNGGGSGDGVANLRARLEQLGGSAEWTSAPGQGTTVTLRLRPD